jgi:hypothetical protein
MLALKSQKTLCAIELKDCIAGDLDEVCVINRYKQLDDLLTYFREVKDNNQ